MRRFIPVTITVLLLASAVGAPAVGAKGHGKAHTFSFYARVVKSSARGLEVRTQNGRNLWFSARQIRRPGHPKPHKPSCRKHHAGHKAHKCPTKHRGTHGRLANDTSASGTSVTINIVGLQPGVTVLITETVNSDGSITITITLPPPAGEQSATGVVSSIDDDAFVVQTADGSSLRLYMAHDALSSLGLQSCNTVNVSYHQDAGVLIADHVNVTGHSTSGDCTPTESLHGTITAVSGTSLTIDSADGSVTVMAGSVDLSGFQVGDVVDVTYTKADDGTLTATDVEYAEQSASGTATNVSSSSLTITTDDRAHSLTFVAGKGMQVQTDAFDGVHVGDHVNVSYHVSGGKRVADCVQVGPGPSDDESGGDGSGETASS